MLRTPRLSDKHIQIFNQDGFLILRQAFNIEEMESLVSWSDEMLARPEVSGKHWVYHEQSITDDTLVNRIENIAPFHLGFRELTKVLALPVGQLLNEKAVLFKEKINFKIPGGGGFKAHQDSQAGWEIYADFFINVLVSIDAATPENGCLELSAGYHKQRLLRLWEPLTESDMQDIKFIPIHTEPGDIVFFDSYTPHQSAPNLSNHMRRIYYATYNRRSAGEHMAKYYADKHKNFPPDIDREPNKNYVYQV